MKKKLLLSLVLLAIAGTEASLQAGKGGAIAGGIIGGTILGTAIANSNNNRGTRTVYVDRRYDDDYDYRSSRRNRREIRRLRRELEELRRAQS